MHEYGNQGVEAVVAPLAIILYHPPGDVVLPILTTQGSAWLEICFQIGSTFTTRRNSKSSIKLLTTVST